MAQKINLILDQGTTFNTSFSIVDVDDAAIDFSSYTANAQMRKSYYSSNGYTFTVAMDNTGLVTLSMSSNTTTDITAGRYVYDVEVEKEGIRSRIVEGIVIVTPQVTK